MLISRYVLDIMPFEAVEKNATWETCSLRKWLHNTFISSAFSDDEVNLIQSTTHKSEKTSSGTSLNATIDRVFLLNDKEYEKYLHNTSFGIGNVTDYANSKKSGSRMACSWWLRTPGINYTRAAYVDTNGDISYSPGSIYKGAISIATELGVRPVIWINLELK